MNKKILFALSIVLVAIMAMGAVSAGGATGALPIDFGSLFGGDSGQNVTLDGVTFYIPGGYEENADLAEDGTVEDYEFFTSTAYEKGYTNGDSYINVRVVEYDGTDVDEDLTNYMDGVSKTINGIGGYQYYDGIGYTFTYSMGQKVVTVQSDDADILSEVIVA